MHGLCAELKMAFVRMAVSQRTLHSVQVTFPATDKKFIQGQKSGVLCGRMSERPGTILLFCSSIVGFLASDGNFPLTLYLQDIRRWTFNHHKVQSDVNVSIIFLSLLSKALSP